jgi:nucleotide-binding universal stress UspA family protein
MTPSRIEHILCPTDYSEFSDRALLHAIALARAFEAKLKVVHVIPYLASGFESAYGAAPWLMTPEIRENARTTMDQFLAPARAARVDHTSEVREGNPWEEVLAAARETRADVVVLGTHGRGGFDRLLIGSVAEKLIRRLDCSVLAVCHESGHALKAPHEIRRIVIATDFASSSLKGLSDGLAIARKTGADVTVVHAIEHAPEPHAHPEAASYRAALLEEGLSKVKQALAEAGGEPRDTPRIAFGRPSEQILDVAASEGADLIVMGAQGHGMIEHLISGSNTQHVIRNASCPVLIARHRPAAQVKHAAAMLAPIALYSALS